MPRGEPRNRDAIRHLLEMGSEPVRPHASGIAVQRVRRARKDEGNANSAPQPEATNSGPGDYRSKIVSGTSSSLWVLQRRTTPARAGHSPHPVSVSITTRAGPGVTAAIWSRGNS